jgi:hypothetical protein
MSSHLSVYCTVFVVMLEIVTESMDAYYFLVVGWGNRLLPEAASASAVSYDGVANNLQTLFCAIRGFHSPWGRLVN